MAGIDNLTPWQPGQSGNPAGKPKGTKDRRTIVRELLEALDQPSGLTVAQATTAAVIKKALGGDTIAWEKLFDSGYGKVSDKQEVTGADGQPLSTSLTVEIIKK